MSTILGALRKTIQEYELIKPGDRIAVGLSGGKDSTALLWALKKFQRFSTVPFDLEAITISNGFENFDLSPMKRFCDELQVPYHIEETEIAKIVFDIRKEKNPCSLCAKMRRGALTEVMNREGLNVLALGHHADDALQTLMMNMLYTGKLSTFEVKSYLSRSNVTMIRPLIGSSEQEVIGLVRQMNLPVIASPCPATGNTKRQEISQLLSSIYKNIPHSRASLLTAMKNEDQMNLWFPSLIANAATHKEQPDRP